MQYCLAGIAKVCLVPGRGWQRAQGLAGRRRTTDTERASPTGALRESSESGGLTGGLRRLIKTGIEASLCRSGATRLVRRRHIGDTLVLAWHNIIPDGLPAGGDRSLHLPRAVFARQLDLLRRTHDVVPIEALLERPAPSRWPRAVITFDDAYQGAITVGVEELRRRRLPATFFVAPAYVGGASFWWDALADAGAAGPPPEVREHALTELGGRESDVRRWAAGAGLRTRDLPSYQTCATERQLQAVAGDGITFGSHSWGHPWLPALDGEALRRELEGPRGWLAARFPNVVDWLAYPYGGFSAEVARAAAAAGYVGALRVEGGWVGRAAPRGEARFRLPRYNVPAGLSAAGFELRISGIGTR
jgi:peptidoglycan/xylan/chitin deacetylase (PgdA/CDA1 family)